MKKIVYPILAVTLLFSACSDKDEDVINENDIDQCLMSRDYKYEDLLTKTDIAKHVKIDEPSYKREISAITGEYGSCTYEWKSDRPDMEMELLGQIIQVADKNQVTIRGLGFYTDQELKLYSQASAMDLFDQTYKTLSQDEYNELLANLEKEYANDPERLKQAIGFLDARMLFDYARIDGLGSRAYYRWNQEHGGKLQVLSGGAYFTIESKTSGDSTTSLEHAINFAQEVLDKCSY